MERVSARVFSLDVGDLTDNSAAGEALVEAATGKARVKRVRNVARNRNRRLEADLRDQHFGDAAEAAIDALRDGGSVEEARRAIAGISDKTRNRADRIGSWETDSLNTEYTRRFHEAAGIDSYTWITQRDDDVRPAHEEREGEVFKWANPPDDGHPGVPPNCRCSPMPVLPDLPPSD